MDKITIIVDEFYNNKTIKEFLKINNIGRGRVESIRVSKSSYINGEYKNIDTVLHTNDTLTITFEEEVDFEVENKPLEILYEDDYILIVNKPSNMIIHPDDKTKKGTLVNLVASYYVKHNIHRKVRFVHRIDKETTGIILFAKDFLSEAILLDAISKHDIKRDYLALCYGIFYKKGGKIEANIGEDRHVNNKMCVTKNGKTAITNYKVMKEFFDYSLVKFSLETGRTHQIRVHSSYLGHPLLGDTMYGGESKMIQRVALHSYEINFTHPISKEKISVKADLPYDMKKLTSYNNK